MAANPKTIQFPTTGRFCRACGEPLGEGKKVDECDGCRAYLRRVAKTATPRKIMSRRMQVQLWDRRLELLLPGDPQQMQKKSAAELKVQPLSPVHSASELKKPTKPSLRVVRR